MASANCSSKRKLRQNKSNKAASAEGAEIREISEELFVIQGNSAVASHQSDPAAAAEVVQLQKQRQRRQIQKEAEYSRSCTGSFCSNQNIGNRERG